MKEILFNEQELIPKETHFAQDLFPREFCSQDTLFSFFVAKLDFPFDQFWR